MKDWGAEAHKVAAEHLDACEAAFWCEQGECEQHMDNLEKCESPAIAPFCDCQTCVIREVLHVAWPVIEAAVRSGDFDVHST